jgi:rhamnosyltransferase
MQGSVATEAPPFAVVLAAYNGAAHIEDQVESIRAQTAARWRLYVRDDGSCDGTQALLAACAARDPRIEFLPSDGLNLGPPASFGLLLQRALDCGERYVFLSDQDDVWLPDKCARMLAALRAIEVADGAEKPLLLHSDLRVVDEDLTVIHESFTTLLRIDAGEEMRGLRELFGNSVTGCATLVNAALLRCALPMPQVAMHDWWLGLCAAAFGRIEFLPEPSVLYRQHGRNVVGARGLRERAATVVRTPRAWWLDSAGRFLAGLRQLWILRARARSRGLPVAHDLRDAVELLWRALAEGGSLWSRITAVARTRAWPRSLPMRGLLLTRVAVLPLLRSRLGDERPSGAEA